MVTALIIVAVIAMFGLGLLCALGILKCGPVPDHPKKDTK